MKEIKEETLVQMIRHVNGDIYPDDAAMFAMQIRNHVMHTRYEEAWSTFADAIDFDSVIFSYILDGRTPGEKNHGKD